jgi:hypothetical protein
MSVTSIRLYGVISQKTVIFLVTAVKPQISYKHLEAVPEPTCQADLAARTFRTLFFWGTRTHRQSHHLYNFLGVLQNRFFYSIQKRKLQTERDIQMNSLQKPLSMYWSSSNIIASYKLFLGFYTNIFYTVLNVEEFVWNFRCIIVSRPSESSLFLLLNPTDKGSKRFFTSVRPLIQLLASV